MVYREPPLEYLRVQELGTFTIPFVHGIGLLHFKFRSFDLHLMTLGCRVMFCSKGEGTLASTFHGTGATSFRSTCLLAGVDKGSLEICITSGKMASIHSTDSLAVP